MKHLIYATNSNDQAFTEAGNTVNFGSVVRRMGCNIQLSGGNVVVTGKGYYNVMVNLNITGGGAGNADISVLHNSIPVQGAETSVTLAAGDSTVVSIPVVIKQTCCCEEPVVVLINGVAGTINSATIIVESV